jgi:drug/metabolite transporter (DMT)-like permease
VRESVLGSIGGVEEMEKQTIYLALLFALIAAVGNALFAFGQKKSVVADQPFIFIISALVVCLALFAITFLFLPKPEISTFIKDNYPWVLISGLGFWLIFIGFYFLYSRYGASHYVVYAVLSIVSTSIIVGIIVFKEAFNLYHFLSVITAILTVVLFTIGQAKSS